MSNARYSANVGAEKDGRAMIGTTSPLREGGVMVNDGMIRLVCGSVQDANPRYWGGGESPPAMLLTWILDMPWAPGQPERRPPMAVAVPLPGDQVVNVGQRVELLEPIRVGDTLAMTETLVSISDESRTRLGVGHFVTTEMDVVRQDGVKVAKVRNDLFRYRAQ